MQLVTQRNAHAYRGFRAIRNTMQIGGPPPREGSPPEPSRALFPLAASVGRMERHFQTRTQARRREPPETVWSLYQTKTPPVISRRRLRLFPRRDS